MRSQIQKKPVSSSYSPPAQKATSWQRPFSDPVHDAKQDGTVQSKIAPGAGFNLLQMKLFPDAPTPVQAKLSVGAPGDKYEQQADSVATKVMTMPAPENEEPIQREALPEEKKEEKVQTKPLAATITPLVQRETAPEEPKQEEEVQTKALSNPTIQRETAPEEPKEEEEVQTKALSNPSIQRETAPEEPKEEEEVQTKALSNPSIQRETAPEEPKEEEEVQTKALSNPSIQRETTAEEPKKEEDLPVQAKAESEGKSSHNGNLESQLNGSKGGGSPLPDEVRAFMEPRFGADFSGVRVHTGSDAVQMNRDLNAQAFTHKQDVYFGAGKAPGKDALTAHELTHVVQQNGGGAVENTPIQRYTESTDRNYQISENKKFAVSTAKYPKDIYSSEKAPMDLRGGLEWKSGGNKEIDNITYTQYTADISKYENKKGKPGTEHFCGELARGLTEVDQKVDQSTSDAGGVLYDSDTSPGRDDGWENHYASVVMRDGGDHASFETAVGIPEVWVGIYGKEKGQTFKYKTQEANIERLLSMEDIVLPGKTKMEKSFFDYLFCRQGKEVVITKETRIPRGITAEEAQQWKEEMIAWKETGAEPTSEYMKSVIAILNAEQKKLNP